MRKFILAAVTVASLTVTAALADNAAMTVTPQNTDMLSTKVVGLDVYDGQKNDIGKIQDVIFGEGKAVKGYILSVGGFLGMGTHYVAVDPGTVNIHYDPDNKKWHADTSATKEQLKAAPEFKYEGQWEASKT